MQNSDWCLEWASCVVTVQRELMLCGADERQWQKQHIDQVVALKDQLHQLFVAAGGLEGCAECDGACCARGQHHMTLVEVLSALLRNRPLPSPDPAVTCPFLTLEGCSLEPGLRPFNCVTFNCEIVEEHLTAEQVARFYALERELRALYEVFEERYAGASLRGLVIRSRRLGGRRLLGPPPAP